MFLYVLAILMLQFWFSWCFIVPKNKTKQTKENKKKANILDHFDKYVKALGEIITKPFCLHDLIVPEEIHNSRSTKNNEQLGNEIVSVL